MSKHSIVAICRFGGEFVTGEDGSLSYKGGEAHAMPIDDQMMYADFKSELVEMFRCDNGTLMVKYFLPGNKKTPISISNQKDLERMISFHRNSETTDVYVAMEKVAVPDVSNMRACRSSQTTVSEETGHLVDDAPVANVDDTTQHIDLFDSSFSIVDDTTNGESDIDTSMLAPSFPPLSMDENQLKGTQKFQDGTMGIGQRFKSMDHFREALRQYAIANQFAFKYKKNDCHRVTVKCKSEGCPWRIHASRLSTTQLVCIKKMDSTHTCDGGAGMTGNQATISWVANIVKEKLREDPSYKPKDIVTDISQEYGIKLNYYQAWRGKEKAMEQLQGSYKESYKKLPLFCEKIMETNPGSLATFTTKDDSIFQSVFVSFHASISGFQQGCRPLIFLDSAPLKSKYQGMLLAATAADGNNGVFPIAFAVVDMETNENWSWFLVQLKTVLFSFFGFTIVADNKMGKKETIFEIFNDMGVHHGYCVHYLSEQLFKDLNIQFSEEVKRLITEDFFAAAYAPNPDAFMKTAENIKNISLEAYNWVMLSEPAHWANAYFPGSRYNHLKSNFGELFYSWTSEAHELPIVQMINVIRGKITELFGNRREESNQWLTRLTPSMEELLKNESSKVYLLQVRILFGNKFEVHGESIEIVDIDQWDCSCRGWQLTGLPCCHAIAAITCLGRDPYDYCSRYLTTYSYRLTYSGNIQPVPILDEPLRKENSQEVVNVTPPTNRRPPGRPSKRGNSSQEVGKRQLKCSRCMGAGHNRSTCKEIM